MPLAIFGEQELTCLGLLPPTPKWPEPLQKSPYRPKFFEPFTAFFFRRREVFHPWEGSTLPARSCSMWMELSSSEPITELKARVAFSSHTKVSLDKAAAASTDFSKFH